MRTKGETRAGSGVGSLDNPAVKLFALLAAGLVVGLLLVAARSRSWFVYRPGPLSEAQYGALTQRTGWRAEPITVAPGVELRGLVRRPRDADAPWLLLLPGNGEDVLRGGQALLEGLAGDQDLGLAVWTYRGFDGAPGAPGLRAFEADTILQHRHLVDRLGAQQIHLVSFSLGTALALRIAALLTTEGKPPAKLALLSAYDAIDVRKPAWYGRLAPADHYDAEAWAKVGATPVLLVHGANDEAIPIAAARRLAATLGTRARLIELPGRGHADWISDATALEPIRTFLLAP